MKRFNRFTVCLFALVLLIVQVAVVVPSYASDEILIEALHSKGVVKIQMSQLSQTKNVVLIEKDGTRYTYPLNTTQPVQFPLQMGNGVYQVRIMEQISGTKYKELSQATIDLNLEDSNSVFLNSIQDINWEGSSTVVELAQSLTRDAKTDEEKVLAIYRYVTQQFSYDYNKAKTVSSGYIPNVDELMRSHSGICYDYAAVFAAMSRSVGIPTQLIKGYSTTTGSVYHAWNAVYVNGSWKTIDSTVDSTKGELKKGSQIYKSSEEYTVTKIY